MISETDSAVTDIMEILHRLPSPRHAAAVVACVRANIWLEGGGDTPAKIAQMMNDDDTAALEIWETGKANRP